MTRAVLLVGGLLVLAGTSLFLWKATVLDLPVIPSRVEGLWRVELEILARGGGRRGSVRAALPSTGPGQVIFDETSAAERLVFAIRSEDDQRTGVWRGRFTGAHRIVHSFRVELSELEVPIPDEPMEPPESVRKAFSRASAELPAGAPDVRAILEPLGLPRPSDAAGRLRMLFGFVADEIATAETGSEDALLTLGAREGRPEGKVRLLVTLLRAAGVPARPAVGLRLPAEGSPERVVWAEAWIAGSWVPAFPVEGVLGRRPEDVLLLRSGSLGLVEATGVEAVTSRHLALRELLRPEELGAMMVPSQPVLASLSLYRLPVGTQAALRGLLLLPLGVLVTAIFRNLVGLRTFGTFMPVLIAFALRYTSLATGLLMVAGVIALGIGGRLALERLRLLLVPRLAILLCVVVLVVTGLALTGRTLEGRAFFGGVLLPMVILTMLIERFSVTLAEEGVRSALVQAGSSVVVAVAVYPLFRSSFAEHLMFGFPELVVAIMGVLVWIGGYTGYRLADVWRFRSLARTAELEP